jgi:hypothetical protein
VVQQRSVVIATIALCSLATACSGEDFAESVIERQLAADGADVDLDLSGGAIRVETDDGTFEMTTDDDGAVSIRTEDDDGGTTVIEADGDEVVMTDGDESVVVASSAELPADFPADFPLPAATLVNSARSEFDDQVTFTLVFEAPGAIAVAAYEELAASLGAAGYTTSFESSDGTNVSAQLSDGTTDVFFSGGHDPADDFSRFGVTLSPTPG